MVSQIYIDPTARISNSVIIKGNGRLIVGAFCTIEESVTIDTSSNIESVLILESRVKIKTGSILRTYGGFMKIGSRTSVGEFNLLASHGGLSIGCECMFGPYVFVNSASHITEGDDPFRFQGETMEGISIGDGVWLGARCSILDGVSIGPRTIIGAHSLVLSDIPSGCVAFGQPAKVHRAIDGDKHESVS